MQELPRAPVQGLAPSLEKRRLQVYLGKVIADVVILLGSFVLCSFAYLGGVLDLRRLETGLLPAYLLLPLFLTIALYNGSYSRAGLTRWQLSSGRVVSALLISAALLNLIAFLAKMNADFSRVVFVAGLVLSAALLVGYRVLLARAISRRWGANSGNRLVIAAGGPLVTMPDALVVDAAEHGLRPDSQDPLALDRLAAYLRNMDEVIVSCAADDRKRWAQILKGTGIRGEVVHPFSHDIGAIGVMHYAKADLSTLLVSVGQLGIRARAMKRLVDIALSALALLILSPVLLLAALAIKLEDGGPVLFRQRRMGRGNSLFDILKFRTMRAADADGLQSTRRDDERITRIGRLLRSTSLDELPQLINVLRGDMSLVGPRPHALGSQAGEKLFWQVDPKYWQRHSLRPGITGLAQSRGLRGATDTEGELSARLQADLEYLQGWSLWRDFAIMLATLRVLIHPRAY